MHYRLVKTMTLAEMIVQRSADSPAEMLELMPIVHHKPILESIIISGYHWSDDNVIILEGNTVIDGVRRIKAALDAGISHLPCRVI